MCGKKIGRKCKMGAWWWNREVEETLIWKKERCTGGDTCEYHSGE